MKISLDGGALCAKGNLHFGNYTFTQSLIEAVAKYDQNNEYLIYSFCQKPSWLALNKNMHYQTLRPTAFWLSTRVSIEEIRQKKDLFLALNQAIPFSTKSKIIAFSHGLSYYFYPQFYPDSYHALKDELDSMIKKSHFIIVASRRVKMELQKLFPSFKHFATINYGVPLDMLNYQPVTRKKYFLFVGMNHRIKNIEFIVKAFKRFKQNKKLLEYKLFLVGGLKEFEDKESGIFPYPNTTRADLRKLYAEATAYLTASVYESFNFPVLEALAQNCPVIGLNSAIIPEFKQFVYQAYDANDFIAKMTDIAFGGETKVKRDEIIKRFSWKKYITELKKLYMNAIKS